MARGGGSPLDQCILERVDDRHVKGNIFAPCPVGDEDVCRLASLSRQQGTAFPCWPQASRNCSIEDFIPQPIVTRDSLTMPSTVEGVVPEAVTWLTAGWAGSIPGVNRVAKAISQRSDELLGFKEKTEAGGRDRGQPITGVRAWEADGCKPRDFPSISLPGQSFRKEGFESNSLFKGGPLDSKPKILGAH